MRAALLAVLIVATSCVASSTPEVKPPVRPKTTPAPPRPSPTVAVDAKPVPPAQILGAPPPVRVVLSRPTAAAHATVAVKGGWTLVSHDGDTVRSGAGLTGDLVLGITGATLAGAAFPDDAELRPATDGDLRVDTRVYGGILRVERGPDGKRRVMIALGIEAYVASVVNSEIPAAFPREAQRTQAILARTYALCSTVRTSPDAPLVLTDVGAVDQEFAGNTAVAEHRRIGTDAADSTRGVILCDGGAPLLAYYHSTCGGTTCPGEVVFGKLGAKPALAGGVVCPWCTASKYFKWDARIAGADVAKAAGLTGTLQSFAVSEKTAGGRAVTFDVGVGGKSARVRAGDFRRQVGASLLRSVLLDDAAVVAGELVCHGRGWGHGVGLCQMGAKTLAEKGMKAESILGIYYPGSTLEPRW